MPKSPKISIVLEPETYQKVKIKCALNHEDMSAYGRRLILQDLAGDISSDNLNLITSILRSQTDLVFEPYMERIIKLLSATCIQAGSAAYLSAEALSSFVPTNLQHDFTASYEMARKKSLLYLKNYEK